MTSPETTLAQRIFRLLLGILLLCTGVAHLTFARREFLAQVPGWLPLPGDAVVVASGLAELLLGLALGWLTRFRVPVGWLTALFFVAVFPGNIYQYVHRIDAFGLDTDAKRFFRLFWQPLLVFWALWSTGAWRSSGRRV